MKGSESNESLKNDDTEACLSKLAEIEMQEVLKVFVEEKRNRIAAEDFLKKFSKSRGKNSAGAKTKKQEGDEKLKKKQYKQSLNLYTECIFLANRGDECLPLAYANRSFVLFKMNHPKESLVDIDLALESGYPKTNSEKLLLRKAKCLVALGDIEEAKRVLTETSQTSNKKEIQKFIKTELVNVENVSSPEEALPELTGGENEDFVYASKYLSVHYNEAKGRHVIANKDIKPGDVLFVEKPFAFVLRKSKCHNCFKEIIAPIPCWDCSEVYYCSPKCREEFTKSIHSFECGSAELFKSLGVSHLSLRVVLSVSSCLEELKQNLKKVSKPEIRNGIVLWKEAGYDRAYNLVHHSDKHDKRDFVLYAKAALILSTYLKNHTNYFPPTGDDKDLLIVTSVIWLHILHSICNGYCINTASTFEERAVVENLKETMCGTAIYPSTSMLNHSCNPSVTQSFAGNWIVVRAAKTIKKGSEVFTSYGPESRIMDRASRQEILSKQYCFQCECPDCLLKVDVHDIFRAFKCANCKGPSVLDAENADMLLCVECGSTQESAELLYKRNKFYSLIRDDPLQNEDIIRLKHLLAGWKLGREILYRFHKDLGSVADQVCTILLAPNGSYIPNSFNKYIYHQLAHLLTEMGEYRRAIMFLKCSCRAVEVRFGSFSVELADELKKLVAIYSVSLIENRNLIVEAKGWYQKAEAIMTTLHGPNYEGLVEMKNFKMLLERMGF